MMYYIRSIVYGYTLEIVGSNGIQQIKDERAVSFINRWCLLYGSTYEGRRAACAQHMNIRQKVPILISECSGDIMFPTRNVRSFDCVWINYRAMEKCYGNAMRSKIVFLDGSILELGCDVRILRRECKLCEEYLALIHASPH